MYDGGSQNGLITKRSGTWIFVPSACEFIMTKTVVEIFFLGILSFSPCLIAMQSISK